MSVEIKFLFSSPFVKERQVFTRPSSGLRRTKRKDLLTPGNTSLCTRERKRLQRERQRVTDLRFLRLSYRDILYHVIIMNTHHVSLRETDEEIRLGKKSIFT